MKLKGDSKLSVWFIPYFAIVAIILGEILPVWLQTLGGVNPSDPGAKQSIFAEPMDTIGSFVVYSVLAVIFYYVFKKIHWIFAIFIAMALGIILEFTICRPEESFGPNVVENPRGAVLFFIIVWPIIVMGPYAIYKFFGWLKKKLISNQKING